jgi:hypothetical protein
MAEDVTLTLVRWPIGTSVGAYPRLSEQQSDQMPPVVPVSQVSTVENDNSLTYHALADGEYWAAAPLGDRWQYVAFNVQEPEPTLDSLDERTDVLEGEQAALVAADDSLDARVTALESAPPPDTGGGGTSAQWIYDNAEHSSGSMIYVFKGTIQLVVPEAGAYLLQLSCQLKCGGAFTQVVAGIGVDGVVDEGTEIWRNSDNPASEPTTMVSIFVQTLAAGAVVRPMMRTTSSSPVSMAKTTIVAQKLVT